MELRLKPRSAVMGSSHIMRQTNCWVQNCQHQQAETLQEFFSVFLEDVRKKLQHWAFLCTPEELWDTRKITRDGQKIAIKEDMHTPSSLHPYFFFHAFILHRDKYVHFPSSIHLFAHVLPPTQDLYRHLTLFIFITVLPSYMAYISPITITLPTPFLLDTLPFEAMSASMHACVSQGIRRGDRDT